VWALGDFDYNGFVDDDDVTLLNAFYDPSAPPLDTSNSTWWHAVNRGAPRRRNDPFGGARDSGAFDSGVILDRRNPR
jgi:hypothetical protein